MLPTTEHDATRGVFNTWRAEIAERQGVNPADVSWKNVTKGEIWSLSEKQFEVTKVPTDVRREYFRQFNDFINSSPSDGPDPGA